MVVECTSFHFFLENAGDICRKDDLVFFAEHAIWGIPSKDMLLLSAAVVVEDFSQIRAPECLMHGYILNAHFVV